MVPRMQFYMDCLVSYHILYWGKDINLSDQNVMVIKLIHSTLSRTNQEKDSICLQYIRIFNRHQHYMAVKMRHIIYS